MRGWLARRGAKPWTALLRDQRGASAMLVAFCVPLLFGFAMIAVDLGQLHKQRNLLQIAADAAALAAAYDINGSPVNTAVEYAEKNNLKLPGEILKAADVQLGNWDAATRNFDPTGTPVNAVQVTTRRSQANANPVSMYFAALFGFDAMDVNARAAAIWGGDNDTGAGDCWESGARSGGTMTMGQDVFLETTCIYGQDGVSLGQDPYVGPESSVGTPDCVSYPGDCDGFTTGQDPGIYGNVIGMDLGTGNAADDPTMTRICIQNFIAMLRGGMGAVDPSIPCGDVWPPQITAVVESSSSSIPLGLAAGTAFISSNSIMVSQQYNLTDNFIISEEDIVWGQNGYIRNTVNSCVDFTQTTIGVFAVDDVTMGQNARIRGAALWAGLELTVGQNVASLGASLRSGGDMFIAQDPGFEGCEVNFNGAFGLGGGGGGGGEQHVRLVK